MSCSILHNCIVHMEMLLLKHSACVQHVSDSSSSALFCVLCSICSKISSITAWRNCLKGEFRWKFPLFEGQVQVWEAIRYKNVSLIQYHPTRIVLKPCVTTQSLWNHRCRRLFAKCLPTYTYVECLQTMVTSLCSIVRSFNANTRLVSFGVSRRNRCLSHIFCWWFDRRRALWFQQQ